ncbi:hypothetical protein sscle_08g066550 [Sclerotinia sclerotiorum 1980 UF-70]|uniref:Uncharacterized protein n=1 Tax=Sclerotinia sclerotiorum (strain ATCC 18683 / 1980 / Ss-1) TaxID=665079 RepID=A0A1D9QAC3_SCLS1|nr:hypothetical protein sscle_08g066550 [Sclerotinia sclerotiorum 1980 UF-70]
MAPLYPPRATFYAFCRLQILNFGLYIQKCKTRLRRRWGQGEIVSWPRSLYRSYLFLPHHLSSLYSSYQVLEIVARLYLLATLLPLYYS